MSRALPLLLAATITSGIAGAALVPSSAPASSAAPGGVSALADGSVTVVVPTDWTTAGMYVGRAVALQDAARLRAARAAAAAADEAARAALALDAARRASRTRLAAVSYGSPRDIARSMLASRGWSGQYGCLDSLWSRESGWSTYASNGSGAYGIPQALPGSKMASAGSDWRTNPATQIRWGLGYISASYGTPCAAWGHSQQYGWY